MVKNLPPQKIRAIFFILAILCDVTGYAIFSEKGYGGSLSSLITMVGIFFMLLSFTFRTKESELKLHSLIQKGTKGFSEKSFLLLALMFIAFFIGIVYLVYSKILKQEYFGRSDYVVSLIGVVPLFLSYSLWEKWKLLKSK